MTTGPTIREDELHAYVDGQLAPERRQAVEQYLRSHPEQARRAEAYAAQRQAMKSLFDWRAEEPVPHALNLSEIVETQLVRRRSGWRQAMAAVALLALGVIIGVGGSAAFAPRAGGLEQLTQEALTAHRVFVVDGKRPVEMRADAREPLLGWLSERTATRITAPDLASVGYRFMGGRLVAAPQGAAAMLMYDNDKGIRITVYIRRMQRDEPAPMRRDGLGAEVAFAWVAHGVGVGVTAPAAASDIEAPVQEIRRQLQPAA